MIIEMKPLSMAEAKEIVETSENEDDGKDIKAFLKKFTKLKPEEAKSLRSEIEALEIAKLKDENIAKIIDIVPEDAVDLNKILVEVSLDEDETNKILGVVKKYK